MPRRHPLSLTIFILLASIHWDTGNPGARTYASHYSYHLVQVHLAGAEADLQSESSVPKTKNLSVCCRENVPSAVDRHTSSYGSSRKPTTFQQSHFPMGRFSFTVFALVILISYSKTSRTTFKVSNLDQRNLYLEKCSIRHCLAPNHKDYSLF